MSTEAPFDTRDVIEEVATDGEVRDPERSAVLHVARFGSFVLTAAEPFRPPHAETARKIVSALDRDPRVVQTALSDESDDRWCVPWAAFPSDPDVHDAMFGSDAMPSVVFDAPIWFAVEVPEKNQRRIHPTDVIPTHYHVIWDGIFILVTWTMPGDDPVIPMSGGHVVEDILRDSLASLALGLYVQACSPGCKHQFAHADLRLLAAEPGATAVEYTNPERWGEWDALVPGHSPGDRAMRLFQDLRLAGRIFTRLKNIGRRVVDLEQTTRLSLDRLMTINYERAEVPLLPWRERISVRWVMRFWRRHARHEIAKVWLVLASIERLRRRWSATRFDFDDETSERGMRNLFLRDYSDDVARVASLDLELIRSGVEQAAQRLDSRAIVSGTVAAAIAGAAAGAVVGAIVTTL